MSEPGPWAFSDNGLVVGPPLPHVLETEVKGELSLYDPKAEKVLVLNRTASDVWLLCDGEQTLGEILQLLASAYGKSADSIRQDVIATIEQFVEEGFLTPP